MAYNSVFPMNYQPMYYQQPYSQQSQQTTPVPPTQNNGIIWVQGEAGAKSYLVAPNTTVQLWDSEEPIIYLKSADASGMPSMKILEYTIRDQNQPQTAQQLTKPDNNYATKEDINNVKEEIHKLKNRLSKMSEVKHEPKRNE